MRRPFLYIAVPFCTGIASSAVFKAPFPYPLFLSAAFIMTALTFAKRKGIANPAFYLSAFFLGIAACQNLDVLPSNHISHMISDDESQVVVKGTVIDDPIIGTTFYKGGKISFLLDVDHIKESTWKKVQGLVKADLYLSGDGKRFCYGDRVVLEGTLRRPHGLKNPGLFDYSKYLKKKGVYFVLKVSEDSFVNAAGKPSPDPARRAAYRLKHGIAGMIDRYLSRPYSGFLKAILIGDRSGLEDRINEDFVKTGTVHIIAVSGLQVGLIAAIFIFTLGLLGIPKKTGLILTTAALIFYAFLVGPNPPIIRAVTIFAIFALGYILRRDADMLNSLSLAALLILVYNPNELYNPSFQLSFGSILSIIVLVPKIDRFLRIDELRAGSLRARLKVYLLRSISVSIAAWIGIAPIVSFYFNITSPIAILANIVVIPLLFVLIAASFIFLSISHFFNILAPYFAFVICHIERALFFINANFSEWPFAYFRTPAPAAAFFILYYCTLASLLIGSKYKKHILIFLLLVCSIFIWKDILYFKPDPVRLTFLDVGQGDSTLIEFPNGGNVLVDGGSGGEEEKFDIGESVVGPYLWNKGIKRIDALVVTHFHEDHIGGVLYILKNFNIGCVIDNASAAGKENKLYDEYRRIIKARRIRRETVRDGDEIGPFGEARLFVLNPERGKEIPDSNDNSIVLKISYKNSSALLCGDIGDEAMQRLYTYGEFLKSDIMKVPHHGGILGDDEMVKIFFEKVSPKFAIISVGRNNRFKAPSKKTIDIITTLNSISYETKDTGAVSFILGQKGPKVEVYKIKN